MNLVVLGASGGCGRWLVRLAAERGGHAVTALVRPSTPFEAPPGVRVCRAEALDPEAIDQAVHGQDIVFSCLGLRRAGPSPWARLLSPPDLTTRVTSRLVESMRRHGVNRIVAISAGGVGDSVDRLSRPVRWLIGSGNIRVAYRDLANMEQVLTQSGLEWLAVRPVTLSHGPVTGRACPVARYGLASTIRRADVAAWMLQAAESAAPFAPRTVLLGTARTRN